jgi:drug/metabolite transporter (DMT)-like permease
MVSATALAWGLDRKRPPAFRIVGMTILLAGLTVIGSDQQAHDARTSEHLWLGDLCFAVAGSLWGVFTYLLGRWKVDPVAGIGQVSILSALTFLPFFLVWHSGGAVPSDIWFSQTFFQGILGGCLAPIAFAKAISLIGASEAALFPALVPSGALLLGVPLLGEWPSASEVVGVAICTAGLLTAFNVMRFLAKAA